MLALFVILSGIGLLIAEELDRRHDHVHTA